MTAHGAAAGYSSASVHPDRSEPVPGRGDLLPAPRALLLENIDPVAVDLLTAAGYEVESRRGALDEADLVAALDGVDLLGIRSKTQVTAEAVRSSPSLVSVGAFCIGTNQIDLAAASEAGVAVFNAP